MNVPRSVLENQKSKIKNQKSRAAFTLVELIIVMMVIVILAVIAVPLGQLLTERDSVPKGATVTQGILSLAKARALNDRTPTGVRLIPRIRQGEIPSAVRMAMTAVPPAVDVDGDPREITFRDLNHPNNMPYRQLDDANGNGVFDPGDLYFSSTGPPGRRGWSDRVDNDTNKFVDDLVYCDQIEYIQDPGPLQDGWAWAQVPYPGPPAGPASIFPRPVLVPVFDGQPINALEVSPRPSPPPPLPAQRPRWWEPVTVAQTGYLPANGGFKVPRPNPPGLVRPPSLAAFIPPEGIDQEYVVFGPYSPPPVAPIGPVPGWPPAWRDNNNAPHTAQRSFDFYTAFIRGEIQEGDRIEFLGGSQVYTIIGAIPAQAMPGAAQQTLPAALLIGVQSGQVPGPGFNPLFPPMAIPFRPLAADIHVPRDLKPNYRILRRPRLIPGEKPIKLPANVVIDLKPDQFVAPMPPTPANNFNRFIDGLTTDGLLGTPDILFAPNGRVLGTVGASNFLSLWVRDTTTGNEDNETLVTIATRDGTVSIFPVNREINASRPLTSANRINYFWFVQRGRSEGQQ